MVTTAQLYGRAIDLATNPAHSRWQSPILLLLDALLCLVIIWKVPCMQPPGSHAIFIWDDAN